jgi:tetratricopeptide (TPR) repeat protein
LYEALPNSTIVTLKKAETLSDLGTLNLQIDKTVALDNFQKACALYTEKENGQKATLLFSIGSLQEEKGQLEAALKSYQDADAIFQKEKLIDELRSSRAVERVKKALEKRSGKSGNH